MATNPAEIVENTQGLIDKSLLMIDEIVELTPLQIKKEQAQIQIAKLQSNISDIDREEKSYELMDNVEILTSTTALVKSQSGKKYYTVNGQTCECPDHKYRLKICKHIQAVNKVRAITQ